MTASAPARNEREIILPPKRERPARLNARAGVELLCRLQFTVGSMQEMRVGPLRQSITFRNREGYRKSRNLNVPVTASSETRDKLKNAPMIKRLLLWDFARASWQYDLIVLAILAFIFLTP